MSQMSNTVKENHATQIRHKIHAVTNFMGGTSYEINPIDTLKIVTASSIFGEPAYYRNGEFAEKTSTKDGVYQIDDALYGHYDMILDDSYSGKKTSDIMEEVIDDALKYDFEATLNWAITLRNEYNMRTNPQIIMVRAAIMTEERANFTKEHPGQFAQINENVMKRADDCLVQMSYYMYKNGDKTRIPGILKRSWANKIETLSRYEINKYKNAEIGLINAVRICHAHNENIDELMKTGGIIVEENDKTWESLRASGMKWEDILNTIRLPHMASLRNLRGIFSEINDIHTCEYFMKKLVSGVANGKQFPYRYLSAMKAIECLKKDSPLLEQTIRMGLEDCMDESCKNLPHLPGNNAFLSDNSGSAWGTCPSEYGNMKIAEIGNLSATIGAVNSDYGTVITFGDRMKKFAVNQREGILSQANKITAESNNVGRATECGIWLFLDEAIENKIVYDNIFIYSDMQAGHGGLYGTNKEQQRYKKAGYAINGTNIDVAKLIDVYRQKVNPKVNVFCIQTAGYNNVLIPENTYRTNILYGWTGKELLYAKAMNDFWDEKDKELTKELSQEIEQEEYEI